MMDPHRTPFRQLKNVWLHVIRVYEKTVSSEKNQPTSHYLKTKLNSSQIYGIAENYRILH
jgi:hypothetical protein